MIPGVSRWSIVKGERGLVNTMREAMLAGDEQEKGLVIVDLRGIGRAEMEKAWRVIEGAKEKRWMAIKPG